MQHFRVNTAEAEQLVMALHQVIDTDWKMLVERQEHQISDGYDMLDKANRLSLYRKLRVMNGASYAHATEFLNHVQVTRWHPDTCGCVVTHLWSSETNEDNRVHHPHRSETHCAAHRDLKPHSVEHHGELLAENQHKNHSRQVLADHLQVPVSEVKTRHLYHGKDRVLVMNHPHMQDKLRHGNATVHLRDHPEASKRPIKLER